MPRDQEAKEAEERHLRVLQVEDERKEAENAVKKVQEEENAALMKALQDDPEGLNALEEKLLKKRASELSVSDMKVLQRRAERMIREMEEDLKTRRVKGALSDLGFEDDDTVSGGQGGPAEPAKPAEDDAKHKHERRVDEALSDMGLVYTVSGKPARPPNLSESELQALAAKVRSLHDPAGPRCPSPT